MLASLHHTHIPTTCLTILPPYLPGALGSNPWAEPDREHCCWLRSNLMMFHAHLMMFHQVVPARALGPDLGGPPLIRASTPSPTLMLV